MSMTEMSMTVIAMMAMALPSIQQIYITKTKFVNTISKVDAIMEINAGILMSPPMLTSCKIFQRLAISQICSQGKDISYEELVVL